MTPVLVAVANVSTTTSTPSCYFANGALQGTLCPELAAYYSPPTWYLYFWVGLVVAMIGLAALYGARVYWEYPFGRFYYHKKGIKAVMHFAGAPGVLGILEQYTDRLFMFTSSGKKKAQFKRLVLAVPGSMTHLRQQDGGDSFTLIDGDKAAPVNPQVEQWAEKNLNELEKTHDWPTFALKVKYAQLVQGIAEASLFPEVSDWNPGNQDINIVDSKGQLVTMKAFEVNKTPEMKDWYIKASAQAKVYMNDAKEAMAKTKAALNGEQSYARGDQTVEFPARKRTEWIEQITKELSTAQGTILDAVVGGKQVTTQYVASVLKHIPNGVYFDSARADVEEKIRKEMKKKNDDLIKLAIVFAIIVCGSALAIVFLSHA